MNRTSLQPDRYGHWLTVPFNPKDYYGFVYCISNLVTGKKYIGCKKLTSSVTKQPLKGRVNKRRSTKESNWKTYTGSSNQLNKDIEQGAFEDFHYEILELHTGAFDLKYAELCCIIQNDAVRSKKYYNQFIGRVGRCPKGSET